MAKRLLTYQCNQCGARSSKWSGRCSSCDSWNSIEELAQKAEVSKTAKPLSSRSLIEGLSGSQKRISTGFKEIDSLLGGGLVVGSVSLIAGEPGIGKSTLLMQLSSAVAARGAKTLYVSGEESVSQIAARAKRLGVSDDSKLELVDTNSADDVAVTIEQGGYSLVIVDSIQTLRQDTATSAAGGVAQVTAAGHLLSRAAKRSNTTLILAGHVTKEGVIAGPKVLEHLVDVVLSIAGDRYSTLRVVRTSKNRYGPTDELLLMDMDSKGLSAVANASKELLKERRVSDGSVVLAAMDGNQPLLVEVQALVNPTHFGYPKRTAVGFELNRLNLIVAMLERRTKLDLSTKDIYLNIVGGFRLQDPGADLAVCMAVASAAKGMKLKDDAAVFGEVGLSGEVRHVQGGDKRYKEASKLGFKVVVGPASAKIRGSSYTGVATVRDALNSYLGKA